MKTDWLGNTYDVGDLVLYAAMSGRSVTMVLAEVVKFNDTGSVTLKPVKSARWKQHYGRRFYIDNRTGKRIDPYRSDKYVKTPVRYQYLQDPELIISQEQYQEIYNNHYKNYRGGWGWTPKAVPDLENPNNYKYLSMEFHDWVESKSEETQKVTIHVTENIVKWTGELPEEADSSADNPELIEGEVNA